MLLKISFFLNNFTSLKKYIFFKKTFHCNATNKRAFNSFRQQIVNSPTRSGKEGRKCRKPWEGYR
jgi:hypothetical protein